MMIEVIPSEIVLAYAGYAVSTGALNLWLAVIFGVIGGTIAQIFVYWIGRYGGSLFSRDTANIFSSTKKQIDMAEEWFNRYGTGVIFYCAFHSGGSPCDFSSGGYGPHVFAAFYGIDGSCRDSMVDYVYLSGHAAGRQMEPN